MLNDCIYNTVNKTKNHINEKLKDEELGEKIMRLTQSSSILLVMELFYIFCDHCMVMCICQNSSNITLNILVTFTSILHILYLNKILILHSLSLK